MPRLIFKCLHVKGGTKKSAAHLGNLVRYVATREGVERIAHRENYVGYIAQRLGSHGLFTGTNSPLVLSRVVDEVANHPGTVWLPIISLRREDAARLGYDSAESWRTLLAAQAPELAKTMKIPAGTVPMVRRLPRQGGPPSRPHDLLQRRWKIRLPHRARH